MSYTVSGGREETYIFDGQGHFKDGCYRAKWTRGDTCYGTRSWVRAGKNNRNYRLLRTSSTGKIKYQEKVVEDDDWKVLVEYNFDDKTMTWSKK